MGLRIPRGVQGTLGRLQRLVQYRRGRGSRLRRRQDLLRNASRIRKSVLNLGPCATLFSRPFPSRQAILVAFLAALITAIAEIWLYIAYSRRSARRAQVGEALRIAETRQAGPSKEHLVRTDEKADEGKQTSSQTEEGGLLEKTEEDVGVPATRKSELTGTVQTSREESGTSTIRLRRRPLGSGLLQDSGTGMRPESPIDQ